MCSQLRIQNFGGSKSWRGNGGGLLAEAVFRVFGFTLSQVPQPLLREICGVAWPHSLATVPLCQLVLTPEPISGAH